jgi:TolB-like protein/DNA-binding winged helix-turn-helix (wHTH) protein/Tfp pilus assembly protein PilF
MGNDAKHFYEFGPFRLDTTERLLLRNGEVVPLTPKTYDTLLFLVENSGHALEKEELFKKLWPESFVEEGTLVRHISILRKALGEGPDGSPYIETLPKRGYRFVTSIREVQGQDKEVQVAGEKPKHRKKLLISSIALGVVVLAALAVYLWRSAEARKAASQPIRWLAVLPLRNLSGDPAQEYLADGMTEELITQVAKTSGLRVISRTSAMHYKTTRQRLPQIAHELQVDAVIEGAVGRSGDRVRVTVQLVHAATDRHLWAEAYERDLRNVMALQAEVARTVSREINRKVTAQTRLAAARPVNPEAYQAYLKGRQSFWERWNTQGLETAIQYYQKAIQNDPSYAPAWAGLADCYTLWIYAGAPLSPREAMTKAKDAAQKALEFDDQLAEAHKALALVKFRYDWDWPGAEKEYKRAVELDPNDALIRVQYAVYLGTMKRRDESLAEIRRAREVDPLSITVNTAMGTLFSWSRRFDDSIAAYQRALDLDRNYRLAHLFLASTYQTIGKYREAVEETLKSKELSGDSPKTIQALRGAYAASGIRGFWLKQIELLKAESRQHYVSPYDIAKLYSRLGMKGEAFQWMEKAYQERNPDLVNLQVITDLDNIRSDPRFTDLLRRMELAS